MEYDVICFSSIDWDFLWQMNQEVMSTLAAQGNQVLFVENTGVRNPELRDLPRIRHRFRNWKRSLRGFRKERENLYVFSPLVLPFPYSRLARLVNRWLLLSALRRWMRVANVHRPVCWTFLPTPLTLDVIKRLPCRALVYYCIDSFADSTPAAQRIVPSEQELFRRADLVFVTSRPLYQQASRWSGDVHLFPCGVSWRECESAWGKRDGEPEALGGVQRPVIGYIGGIHRWIDQELLARTARALPGCSFALVGPVQTDVARLKQEPNILLLGQKPHEELPYYVKHFDVALIPYHVTDYTKHVYPGKLNEYHAMGKPVVSTPLPEVLAYNERYQHIVHVGASHGEFRSAIEAALTEDTEPLRARRMSAAEENSWERRIEAMKALIAQVIERKASEAHEHWAATFAASLRLSTRSRRWIVGAMLALLLVFRTPIVWIAAEPLRMQGTLKPADAIVVFAGGVGESGEAGEGYQERVKQAVELYRRGYAPHILLLSGYTHTFEEADIMRALTVSLGVPAEAILTEQEVRHTYDYVLATGRIGRQRAWTRVLLVTSPYHTRRAAWTFSRSAPELTVILVPTESSYYEHRWGISLRQLRGILHEYAGLLYYWWKQRI